MIEPVSTVGTGSTIEAVEMVTVDIAEAFGDEQPTVVLYFATAPHHNGEYLAPLMADAFPFSVVIGCSSAGEWVEGDHGVGRVAAMAFPAAMIPTAVAALAVYDDADDVADAVDDALDQISDHTGALELLDDTEWFTFVLHDGFSGGEEVANERIARATSTLEIVGGTAADDMAFTGTWVAVGADVAYSGSVISLWQSTLPFEVIKSCAMAPTGKTLTVTDCTPQRRVIHAFNGRPAAAEYAAALGVPVDSALDAMRTHPLGVMGDDSAWVRSPLRVDGNDVILASSGMMPGMTLDIMVSTDVLTETVAMLDTVQRDGGPIAAGIFANCALRRLETDTRDETDQMGDLTDCPTIGWHSYGETWHGHVNQTLTGVVWFH